MSPSDSLDLIHLESWIITNKSFRIPKLNKNPLFCKFYQVVYPLHMSSNQPTSEHVSVANNWTKKLNQKFVAGQHPKGNNPLSSNLCCLPFLFPHSVDKVRQKITSCTCFPAEAPRQAIREAPHWCWWWWDWWCHIMVSYQVKPYHWSIPHLLSSWHLLCEGFLIILAHKPLLIFNGVPPTQRKWIMSSTTFIHWFLPRPTGMTWENLLATLPPHLFLKDSTAPICWRVSPPTTPSGRQDMLSFIGWTSSIAHQACAGFLRSTYGAWYQLIMCPRAVGNSLNYSYIHMLNIAQLEA